MKFSLNCQMPDPTISFQQEIPSYLEDAKKRGWISESELDFLYCKLPTRPIIYTLAKVHKSLTNPPGRPIVAHKLCGLLH